MLFSINNTIRIGLCCTGKCFNYSKIIYLYFGTIVTLLTLDSVVSLSLKMY